MVKTRRSSSRRSRRYDRLLERRINELNKKKEMSNKGKNSLNKSSLLLVEKNKSSLALVEKNKSSVLVEKKKSSVAKSWGSLVALKDCIQVKFGEQYDLTDNKRGYTQVGRNSFSHVQLIDLTVSGEHCILRPTIKDGILIRATIEDRSSNGTWLNSKRMSKRVPRELKNGDVISLVQPYRSGEYNVAAFKFKSPE